MLSMGEERQRLRESAKTGAKRKTGPAGPIPLWRNGSS
jgi:hypothetical protein